MSNWVTCTSTVGCAALNPNNTRSSAAAAAAAGETSPGAAAAAMRCSKYSTSAVARDSGAPALAVRAAGGGSEILICNEPKQCNAARALAYCASLASACW